MIMQESNVDAKDCQKSRIERELRQWIDSRIPSENQGLLWETVPSWLPERFFENDINTLKNQEIRQGVLTSS